MIHLRSAAMDRSLLLRRINSSSTSLAVARHLQSRFPDYARLDPAALAAAVREALALLPKPSRKRPSGGDPDRLRRPPKRMKPSAAAGSDDEPDNSSNGWTNLPDDLLLQILRRLPTAALLSCRHACRRFRSLMSSPSVPLSTGLFLFLTGRCCQGDSMAVFHPQSNRWLHLPNFFPSADDFPVASSGGLVCFRRPGGLAVSNPFLRSHRLLPPMRRILHPVYIGMAADRAANSYQILVAGRRGEQSITCITELYDTASGQWELHQESEQEEFLPKSAGRSQPLIWHEGLFYCLLRWQRRLVCYDMEMREWQYLELEPLSGGMRMVSLVETGGKLLMVGFSYETGYLCHTIAVWELKRMEDQTEYQLGGALLDLMPHSLFEAMGDGMVSASDVCCQAHGGVMFFSMAGGSNSVLYNMSTRAWCLLPKNQGCRLSMLRGVECFRFCGLVYEPSLSARA